MWLWTGVGVGVDAEVTTYPREELRILAALAHSGLAVLSMCLCLCLCWCPVCSTSYSSPLPAALAPLAVPLMQMRGSDRLCSSSIALVIELVIACLGEFGQIVRRVLDWRCGCVRVSEGWDTDTARDCLRRSTGKRMRTRTFLT